MIELGGDYEALIATAPNDIPSVPVDPEDGLLILYTSGTTGLPKGALISHRAQIARMAAFRARPRHRRRRRVLRLGADVPHGLRPIRCSAALMSGAPVVVIDGFRPADVLAAVTAAHRLGWLMLMPGAIAPVIEEMRRNPVTPKGIRAIGAMADLVPIASDRRDHAPARRPYLNSFGATETGLPPASRDLIAPGVAPDALSEAPKLALRAPPGRSRRSRRAATANRARWRCAAPPCSAAIGTRTTTTRKDFRGGWFHMGDLFRHNPDGAYDFVDRAKYMIKSGGENIYPAEIERVLLADPRIERCGRGRASAMRAGARSRSPSSPRATVALTEPTWTRCAAPSSPATSGRRKCISSRSETLPRSTTGKVQRHEVEKWL